MVLGANTFRQFLQMLGPSTEESEVGDPVNTRMRNLPTTVVSTTLEGPLNWPDATLVSGDAVDVVARLKEESEVPLRSPGSLSMNRALMAAGLVDRVQVTIFPVITGQTGVDPIFQGAADFDLELIDSRTLDGHIVATYLLRFDERSRQRRARLMPWRRLQCRSSECLLLSGAIAQRLPVPLAFRRPTHRPVSRQADDSKCQGRLQGQQRRRTNL